MEMHKEDHSNQQLSTEVETNNFGHPVLTEQNIVELLYQDKWNNIKDCKVASDKFVSKYHQIIEDNKETFEQFDTTEFKDDQDGYDQQNRLNWFMPNEYKNFDIEGFVLGQCNTPEQKQRVEYELALYKSHAMMDVLQFLKYMVDTLRKNNIVWGVGRGSSVSSYVLYLLNVHKVDSIKYNLDPTEFLR